ncbi:MAG TPA: hypothetical protein VGP89_18135 [Candidatus Angelobacter sp.]|jgi:hypothetical protein|nr:hypothetical protein [Candidatus Angelobacter sp.]
MNQQSQTIIDNATALDNTQVQDKATIDSLNSRVQALTGQLAVVTADDQSLAAQLLKAQQQLAAQGTFFNLKSKLPAGTKLLANCQGWFNGADGTKHMANVCQSDDPRTVRNQVLAAHAVGIDGFVVDWYGPDANDFARPTDRFTKLLAPACAALGMEFSIMIDSGTFKWATGDHISVLNSALAYIRQKYLPMPNYTNIAGKPVIWEFGWSNAKMDVSAFAKANPDLTVLSQYSVPANCSGSYAWVNGFGSPDAPRQYMESYLAKKDAIQIPCIFDGFDDHNPNDPAHSIWDKTAPARKIPYGQWQMCIDEINKAAATGKVFPAVQICTWNDRDERTQMESQFLALAGLKLF